MLPIRLVALQAFAEGLANRCRRDREVLRRSLSIPTAGRSEPNSCRGTAREELDASCGSNWPVRLSPLLQKAPEVPGSALRSELHVLRSFAFLGVETCRGKTRNRRRVFSFAQSPLATGVCARIPFAHNLGGLKARPTLGRPVTSCAP